MSRWTPFRQGFSAEKSTAHYAEISDAIGKVYSYFLQPAETAAQANKKTQQQFYADGRWLFAMELVALEKMLVEHADNPEIPLWIPAKIAFLTKVIPAQNIEMARAEFQEMGGETIGART